jgi:hypothetical protein
MERLILRPRYFSADEDRVHIRLLRELGDNRLAVEAAKLLRGQAEEIVRLKAEIKQVKESKIVTN